MDSVMNNKIGVDEPLEAARGCTMLSLISQFGTADQVSQLVE